MREARILSKFIDVETGGEEPFLVTDEPLTGSEPGEEVLGQLVQLCSGHLEEDRGGTG